MLYEYECNECKWNFELICTFAERGNQRCPKCKGIKLTKFIGTPAIVGTMDNFGFNNQFEDDVTGKTIDNWKTWEKAGYRQPKDVTRNHDVKEKIKVKMDKIKKGK